MINKILILFTLIIASFSSNSQTIVVLDAGHGYNNDCTNGDGRTDTEINTAFAVSGKLKNKIDDECNWQVYLTRPTNDCGSWISLAQRYTMANNWDADAFISVHCNAGGGTGTETFWCELAGQPDDEDELFATIIQANMVEKGDWVDRRVVEDDDYLSFHLGVLKNLNMYGCLSEIGFVDFPADKPKLLDPLWRDSFALAYYDALQDFLDVTCTGPSTDNSFICTEAINANCGVWYSDTASSSFSKADQYNCSQSVYQGPDRIHQVILSDSGQITATIKNYAGNLDVLILNDCSPDSCVGGISYNSATLNNAAPGTYYVVVDGADGSGSSYDLMVNCSDKADLYPDFISISSSFVGVNEPVQVNWNMYNLGYAPVNNAPYRILYSTDSVVSQDDEVLVSGAFPILFGGKVSVFQTEVSLPQEANGESFLIIELDNNNVSIESDESNNTVYIPITVSITVPSTKSTSFIEKSLQVYPNPSSTLLSINFEDELVFANVELRSITGSQVYAGQYNNKQLEIQTANFSDGIYILSIQGSDVNISKKIIIKH